MGVLSLRRGEKETMDLSHSSEYWKQNKKRTYGNEAGLPLLRKGQKETVEMPYTFYLWNLDTYLILYTYNLENI